jgi:hypothetical protein
LKAIENFTHTLINIEILELGLTLSLESYIVTKEAPFGRQIAGSAKFTQGQKAKFESGLD